MRRSATGGESRERSLNQLAGVWLVQKVGRQSGEGQSPGEGRSLECVEKTLVRSVGGRGGRGAGEDGGAGLRQDGCPRLRWARQVRETRGSSVTSGAAGRWRDRSLAERSHHGKK